MLVAIQCLWLSFNGLQPRGDPYPRARVKGGGGSAAESLQHSEIWPEQLKAQVNCLRNSPDGVGFLYVQPGKSHRMGWWMPGCWMMGNLQLSPDMAYGTQRGGQHKFTSHCLQMSEVERP